jgi:hypothetical protein
MRMAKSWTLALIGGGIASLLGLDGGSTLADPAPYDRTWFTTIYTNEYAQTNLIEIPYQIATGSLRLAPDYFVGVGEGYTINPSFSAPLPFCSCSVNNLRFEVEGQIDKHFGGQDHVETAFAFILRSPQLPLFAGLSVNAAAGEGLSYALELPKFEGSVAAEGVNAPGPRHILNYLTFELEFTQERWKNIHFLAEIHHRSGIWGVIAPKDSGANYLGFGLRADFK